MPRLSPEFIAHTAEVAREEGGKWLMWLMHFLGILQKREAAAKGILEGHKAVETIKKAEWLKQGVNPDQAEHVETYLKSLPPEHSLRRLQEEQFKGKSEEMTRALLGKDRGPLKRLSEEDFDDLRRKVVGTAESAHKLGMGMVELMEKQEETDREILQLLQKLTQ